MSNDYNIPSYFKGIIGLLNEREHDLLVTVPLDKPIGILKRTNTRWKFVPFKEKYQTSKDFTKATRCKLGMLDPDSVYILNPEFKLVKALSYHMNLLKKYDYIYLEAII